MMFTGTALILYCVVYKSSFASAMSAIIQFVSFEINNKKQLLLNLIKVIRL